MVPFQDVPFILQCLLLLAWGSFRFQGIHAADDDQTKMAGESQVPRCLLSMMTVFAQYAGILRQFKGMSGTVRLFCWLFAGVRSLSQSQEPRADAGGHHKEHVSRPAVQGDFPPGVRCNTGEPEGASPFLQCHLPVGFAYNAKNSQSVSFAGENPLPRGTRRTKAQAEQCIKAWAWSWWEGISAEE